MVSKYLPIGTIIELKNQTGKYMIAGYGTIKTDSKPEYYDYVAYKYPYGMLKNDDLIFINIDDILSVTYMGFENADQKNLANELAEILTDTKKEEAIKKAKQNVEVDNEK